MIYHHAKNLPITSRNKRGKTFYCFLRTNRHIHKQTESTTDSEDRLAERSGGELTDSFRRVYTPCTIIIGHIGTLSLALTTLYFRRLYQR